MSTLRLCDWLLDVDWDTCCAGHAAAQRLRSSRSSPDRRDELHPDRHGSAERPFLPGGVKRQAIGGDAWASRSWTGRTSEERFEQHHASRRSCIVMRLHPPLEGSAATLWKKLHMIASHARSCSEVCDVGELSVARPAASDIFRNCLIRVVVNTTEALAV